MDIFLSVGTGLNPQQEAFVCAVEERLRAVGLVPFTIGRNTFSSDAPLRAVAELMDRCAGTVVVALERYRFEEGVERSGSQKQKDLKNVILPTSWNQIEAALSYGRDLPLLVIVDERLHCDGLLEPGSDWYVQRVALDPAALNRAEFSGILSDWRERVVSAQQRRGQQKAAELDFDVSKLSVVQLIGRLKTGQLWSVLAGAAGALGGAFALGKLMH